MNFEENSWTEIIPTSKSTASIVQTNSKPPNQKQIKSGWRSNLDKLQAQFIDNTPVSIASNGVVYRTDKKGLIPAILTKWFEKRVEYRKLSKIRFVSVSTS